MIFDKKLILEFIYILGSKLDHIQTNSSAVPRTSIQYRNKDIMEANFVFKLLRISKHVPHHTGQVLCWSWLILDIRMEHYCTCSRQCQIQVWTHGIHGLFLTCGKINTWYYMNNSVACIYTGKDFKGATHYLVVAIQRNYFCFWDVNQLTM
jgi:hypothetical protein